MTINKLTDEQVENISEMTADVAKRYGPQWDSALVGDPGGNFHAVTSDTIQAVVVQANDDSRDSSWLCDYLEAVSPAVVLTILRELQEYRKGQAKLEWAAEQAECVSMCLDELNVPIDGDEGPLSLWGRVYRYGEISAAEREELQEYRKGATVPMMPETLPCPVFLEPGLRFGKGVKTQTMLEALQRRTEYYAELEAMTPEQRAEHDKGMMDFASMLRGDVNGCVVDQKELSPTPLYQHLVFTIENAAGDKTSEYWAYCDQAVYEKEEPENRRIIYTNSPLDDEERYELQEYRKASAK